MYGVIPAIMHVSLFVSFILMLLATLSVPLINSIWLMRANVHAGVSFLSVHESITFGVWGLCTTNGGTDLFGLGSDWNGDCTKAKLGYSTSFSSNSHVKNLLHGSLAKSLVVFPLATALIFVALLLSIISWFHVHRRQDTMLDTRPRSASGRFLSILETVILLLASFFTTLSFIMSITVDAKASSAAHHSDGLLSITYGPAVWMALVAAILLWFAKIASCCGVLRNRRRRRAAKRGEKY